jgi:hypothetical protein
MSVTTVDGVTKKEGQYVWITGMDDGEYKMIPRRERVSKFSVHSPMLQYSDKKLCEEQCRMMNEKPKI